MRNNHLLNDPLIGDRIDLISRNAPQRAVPGNLGHWRESLSLAGKIQRSLERDRDLPLSQKLHKAVVYISSTLSARLYLLRCTKVGRRARTRGAPYIVNHGRIIIGDDFNLSSRIVASELATGHQATIEIGNEVSINFGALISALRLVKIGNQVNIGPYTVITDSDFHDPRDRFAPPEGVPTIIEDNVWLGVRVIVLKGSHIGHGSVITAGSLVSGKIPPNVIAGGIPARVIRHLGEEDPHGYRGDQGVSQESTNPNVRARLSKVFSHTFDILAPVDPAIGPTKVSRWDSLGHLELIVRLEEEFDIKFTDGDAISMTSFGEIERVIARHLQLRTRNQYKIG
ncbi:MAG: hypothetical protein HYZ01_14090 [Ignavibacteriales bacterium]|nr:hypothetical protein [Ignavibacteriales bacterium]